MSPKVVLVTGCSSGIGRALAQRLHAQRDADGRAAYCVWASARSAAALRQLEAEGLRAVQLDVTDQASVAAAVDQVVAESGRIDCLINNAGLSRIGPLVEQPLPEFEEVMATNVVGVVRVTQAVAPQMMRQRGGLIIMIGSVVSWLSTPFGAAYTCTKAALLALTDSLRLELKPFGVAVSYVTAGSVSTSLAENSLAAADLARYESSDSQYRPLSGKIRERANYSRHDTSSMPAQAAAEQIAAVINRSMLPGPPGWRSWLARFLRSSGTRRTAPGSASPEATLVVQPPNWFLAGGGAALYVLLGLMQKLLGWPTNTLLARRFGLNTLLA